MLGIITIDERPGAPLTWAFVSLRGNLAVLHFY